VDSVEIFTLAQSKGTLTTKKNPSTSQKTDSFPLGMAVTGQSPLVSNSGSSAISIKESKIKSRG